MDIFLIIGIIGYFWVGTSYLVLCVRLREPLVLSVTGYTYAMAVIGWCLLQNQNDSRFFDATIIISYICFAVAFVNRRTWNRIFAKYDIHWSNVLRLRPPVPR